MKLVRFGNPGAEKPGLVDDQGRLRDLSNVITDLIPANLSRSALQKIAAISHPRCRSSPASRAWACQSPASESSSR